MDEQPSGDNPDPQDDAQPPMPEPSQTPDEYQEPNTEGENVPETPASEDTEPLAEESADSLASEENVPVDTPDTPEDSPVPDETTEVSQEENWSAEPELPAEDNGSVNITVNGPEQVEEENHDEPQEPAAEQSQEEDSSAPQQPEETLVTEEEKPTEVSENPPEQTGEQIEDGSVDPVAMPTEETMSDAPTAVPEIGMPLEDTVEETTTVASYVPTPVSKPKSKKRWWIALAAFVLVAAAAAGAYFLFFASNDMTEYKDSTLAFSYPKEWNFTDQGQGGLAFYPGETLEGTNAIFLIFTNTSAIDGYSQMTADQKSQVKTRLLDFFVSPDFAKEINGDQGNLVFSTGQETQQKGAEMALSFDANGSNSAGLASSGILRVLIGPKGENVTLLAIALKEDWTANQDQYLDIASSLQVL